MALIYLNLKQKQKNNEANIIKLYCTMINKQKLPHQSRFGLFVH